MCEKSVKEKIRDIVFPDIRKDQFGPPVEIEVISNKKVQLPGDTDIESKNGIVTINDFGHLEIKTESFEDFVMELNTVITKYHKK